MTFFFSLSLYFAAVGFVFQNNKLAAAKVRLMDLQAREKALVAEIATEKAHKLALENEVAAELAAEQKKQKNFAHEVEMEQKLLQMLGAKSNNLPKGSYGDSCSDIRMHNGILKAHCKGLKSIGCFKDSAKRDLTGGDKGDSNDNTPAKCAQFAAQKGFKYFGVQYGKQCFAGNSYGSQGTASNCNVPVRPALSFVFACFACFACPPRCPDTAHGMLVRHSALAIPSSPAVAAGPTTCTKPRAWPNRR